MRLEERREDQHPVVLVPSTLALSPKTGLRECPENRRSHLDPICEYPLNRRLQLRLLRRTIATGSLHDLLHGLEVVGLHFQVGHLAVALCRGHRRVPQEVLDRAEVCACIQHLRGKGMA